jgi:hypothetical protein
MELTVPLSWISNPGRLFKFGFIIALIVSVSRASLRVIIMISQG